MNHPSHVKKLSLKKKILIIISAVLIIGCITAATVAWLTSKDDPVVNVFVGSKLDIYLSDAEDMHQMQPGDTITFTNDGASTKPYVRVYANSVPCYVFLEVKELGNVSNYVDWLVDNSVFQAYPDVDGYYYAKVGTSTEDQVLDILTNDCVTVYTHLTQDELALIKNAQDGEIGFKFDACAVQSDARTLDQAFAIAKAELDQS